MESLLTMNESFCQHELVCMMLSLSNAIYFLSCTLNEFSGFMMTVRGTGFRCVLTELQISFYKQDKNMNKPFRGCFCAWFTSAHIRSHRFKVGSRTNYNVHVHTQDWDWEQTPSLAYSTSKNGDLANSFWHSAPNCSLYMPTIPKETAPIPSAILFQSQKSLFPKGTNFGRLCRMTRREQDPLWYHLVFLETSNVKTILAFVRMQCQTASIRKFQGYVTTLTLAGVFGRLFCERQLCCVTVPCAVTALGANKRSI